MFKGFCHSSALVIYQNKSNLVTSENYKIKKIISYLNDTASEFEMMEKEIQKTIS